MHIYMKKIISFILLLGVLCLAGCSSEIDPQSVAFSVKELKSKQKGDSIYVDVTANCNWSISGPSNIVHIYPHTGSANKKIYIIIQENKDFEDLTCTLKLTSEDGSASDFLTIHQDKKILLEADAVGLLPKEGHEVQIGLKANTDDYKISVPDWIKLLDSRAIQEKSLNFLVEKNESGGVREDTIKFACLNETELVFVRQDSYTPEAIDIPEFPEYPDTNFVKVNIALTPSYADTCKFELASDLSGCLKLNRSELTLEASLTPGYNPVKILVNNKTLFNRDFKYFPPIRIKPKMTFGTLSDFSGLFYAYFEAEFDRYGYNDVKSYTVKGGDGTIYCKVDSHIDNDVTLKDGKWIIETEAIQFDKNNYKKQLNDLYFEVEFEFTIYEDECLDYKIVKEKIGLPDYYKQ